MRPWHFLRETVAGVSRFLVNELVTKRHKEADRASEEACCLVETPRIVLGETRPTTNHRAPCQPDLAQIDAFQRAAHS